MYSDLLHALPDVFAWANFAAVIIGLDPMIQFFHLAKDWMLGSSPSMTVKKSCRGIQVCQSNTNPSPLRRRNIRRFGQPDDLQIVQRTILRHTPRPHSLGHMRDQMRNTAAAETVFIHRHGDGYFTLPLLAKLTQPKPPGAVQAKVAAFPLNLHLTHRAAWVISDVIRKLKRDTRTPNDEVIERDVILVWSDNEKRVVTGADILGRLLRNLDRV